ncbi:MAG: CDP-alcohol phosphatidyltransferase family protein [Solirubrobacteraceae bacterium]
MAAGRRRLRIPDRLHDPQTLIERSTAGELWAREQLTLLLDARFTPRAVVRFLVNSQRRANAERRARPATARRMRRWIAAGAGAWAGLALAGHEPFRRRLRAFAAWWALTWLMLDWHIGMVETEDGRARNLGPADACTLARVWLAPAAADTPAAWICALAFVSDGLDGRLARASEPTRIGRELEGLADAAFAAAALRGALRRDWLGRAAAISELVRLAISFGYALFVWFGSASPPDPRVLHAARVMTPVRAGGLVAAGLGYRRLANALVTGGAGWSALTIGCVLLPRAP